MALNGEPAVIMTVIETTINNTLELTETIDASVLTSKIIYQGCAY
jgi:hypothetical protein